MSSLTDKVLPIIRQTREMTLPHWGNVEVTNKKTEFAHDVVTKLDLEVEQFLIKELKKIEPDIPFAGEEFGGDRTAKKFWLCDPIDGTAHYVRGLPFCTTMLALIEDGIVTCSVVYDFVTNHLYHAERGMGAYCNDKPIHVSERSINDAYLSYETHLDKEKNLAIFVKLRDKTSFMKTMSAGWEFAMIACGKIEGRVCFDPWGKDWDFAPGSLLVSEAGGVVANLSKQTYDFRNHDFIASNPAVYKTLTEGPDAIFPIS